jgi:hypothetical protein
VLCASVRHGISDLLKLNGVFIPSFFCSPADILVPDVTCDHPGIIDSLTDIHEAWSEQKVRVSPITTGHASGGK